MNIKSIDKENVTFTVAKTLFSNEAILDTSSKFTHKFYINIEPTQEDYKIYIQLKDNTADLNITAKEFHNELIDQQLRIDTEKKYFKIRELIVKQAFSPVENLEEEVKKLNNE